MVDKSGGFPPILEWMRCTLAAPEAINATESTYINKRAEHIGSAFFAVSRHGQKCIFALVAFCADMFAIKQWNRACEQRELRVSVVCYNGESNKNPCIAFKLMNDERNARLNRQ